jgi:hypothetical protein
VGRAGSTKLRDALALVALVALSVSYFAAGRARIAEVAADPVAARRLTASDSEHYLDIARDLVAGDFSLSYVRPTGGPDRAHRQPLYPATLAVATAAGLDGPDALATVNVVLVVLSMWVAYAIGARVYESRLAGLAGALVLWRVPYLWESVTTRLLTEAGYILLGLVLAYAFLRYRTTRDARWLWAAAGAGALAYLQRVNGLFATAAVLVCAAAADALDVRRRSRARRRRASEPPGGSLRGAPGWGRYVAACAVFVAISAPSWVPRLVHAGNPLYHGYLPNFLWVDERERAHVPGPPRFGWRDYAREHDLADAAHRLGYGLHRTLWEAPREKYGRAAAAAMLAGTVVVFLVRDPAAAPWLAAGLLQMLPIAWQALANPVRRIPATALLAFGVVAVIAGAAALVGAVDGRRARASAT